MFVIIHFFLPNSLRFLWFRAFALILIVGLVDIETSIETLLVWNYQRLDNSLFHSELMLLVKVIRS